ncbi:helix-turn-helix transcriptional regulator [Streptomyces sp. SP18CS02]|uniref:helix-turn-helix transcriptional regulator n=1 Tax=Streptomyces sp. SP18CS02 TaxID=3002531 RepID=UPI002E798481|nr:AraC family transcriptional regulator [Streptomyces sp. SP18CS02]MEE1751802.1 AraC family transcriptional regulator [Streptomyces sp. SP18CS02]
MRGTTVLPGTGCADVEEGALPMHRLEVPMPNVMPFAIGTFDTIGPMSRASFPHRHTFYEIVHVTGGTGTHVIDLTGWRLHPPHLCVIAPGQVHHWQDATGLEGSVVLFTEDFLIDHPGDRDHLRRLGERPWLTLDEAAHAWTGRLVAELDDEYRRGAAGFESVLRALLHILVVRAGRLPGPDTAPEPVPAPSGPAAPPASRAASVAEEFTRLISGTDPSLWAVGSCAERIGVTTGYLAEAVKAATGRTPGQLIREARTHEAKRLLARTDLTVRQVADRVGLADPAYFCRFFRRETGVSPGDFRRGGDIHHDHRIESIARTGPAA